MAENVPVILGEDPDFFADIESFSLAEVCTVVHHAAIDGSTALTSVTTRPI